MLAHRLDLGCPQETLELARTTSCLKGQVCLWPKSWGMLGERWVPSFLGSRSRPPGWLLPAPSGLPVLTGHPRLHSVCVCGGGRGCRWGGTAGSWPESRLQSGSPGIPKSSLVAPQCHIRLPPLKAGISDSSSPSPTPSHSCQFGPRLEFPQICGF